MLQSIETKKETDRQACIAKALAAAETESATQAIVSPFALTAERPLFVVDSGFRG